MPSLDLRQKARDLEYELAVVENDFAAAHSRLAGHFGDVNTLCGAIAERGDVGALWRKHRELDAERRRLDKSLYERLGIEQKPVQPQIVEMPERHELLRQWREAESTLAQAATKWSGVQLSDRTLAREGVGGHVETLAEYRQAASTRDALRECVVSGLLVSELQRAERQHLSALKKMVAASDKVECTKAERDADVERRRIHGLLDEHLGSERPLVPEQPQATAELLRQSEVKLLDAGRAWMQWQREQGPMNVVYAHEAEPKCDGVAVLKAYRQADAERQQLRDELSRQAQHACDKAAKLEQQQAKPVARVPSALEQAASAQERLKKDVQRITDEYGPKTKSKGRKGPGHGLSM